MSGSSRTVAIARIGGSGRNETEDRVAVEEPLEIRISSSTAEDAAAKSVSITMRTPGDDAELALGFLYTEGIIDNTARVLAVTNLDDPDTGAQNIVRVAIDPGAELNLDRLERHFYTTSSCGVCGKASLDALRVAGQRSLGEYRPTFSTDMLIGLPGRVRKLQPLFVETGGLHAAAVFDAAGDIRLVREDVGRHNATDKVVGALFEEGQLPAHDLGLFVSGRASFELLQKSLVAGIPFLAAVGAPSSLAVETAEEFDMTLVGFLRDGTFNIYAGDSRIS